MRLEGKVAIITGGGSGMGRVAAQLFAAHSARVVVAEYGEAAGAETVAMVRAAGGGATFVRTDVSKEADAKAMVDHALATYGRLDCLYNNAGVMPEADHSVTDTDVATWDAVLSLTRSLAVQFGPHGTRSNAICPGPVETPLLMDWLLKDEAAKQLRLARNPSGRFGKPEEIVNMVIYLASDESRWTNGASLVVDGGITVNYF